MATSLATSVGIADRIEGMSARATARGVNRWLKVVLATAVDLAPLGPEIFSEAQRARAALRGEHHPGHLKESGRINEEVDERDISHLAYGTGEIVFDAVYAALQHEELGFEHPQGGEAKYLEKAVKIHMHELEVFVGQELRREFAGVSVGPVSVGATEVRGGRY